MGGHFLFGQALATNEICPIMFVLGSREVMRLWLSTHWNHHAYLMAKRIDLRHAHSRRQVYPTSAVDVEQVQSITTAERAINSKV